MRSTKLLTIVFSMIIFTGITASSTAFAESGEYDDTVQDILIPFTDIVIVQSSSATGHDQNTLDSITDIEFRTVTDFHTYLPDSHISFDVSCNQLAGEFAIGFNTFIQKSDGSPADVNDIRNLVFLQRGSSDSGAFIDAVNTGPDRLKLTAEVTCAKLLPVPLPTVSDAPTEFSVTTGDQVAKLIWKEPEFDGDSSITTYQISAKPDPRTSAASDVFAETADTFFTFDGLVNGITYKFQVNAVNDVGPGIASEIITGTPHAPYVPAPTTTPTIIPTTEKTAVCHNEKTTLYLPVNAVRAHLDKHGDYRGECSNDTASPPSTPITNVVYTIPTTTTQPTEKTAVCHNEKTTLYLPSQALRDHLHYHSDVLGKCLDHTFLSDEKEAKRLQLEADKAQREADRLAKQEAKQLQLEQEKAQKQADRLAKQEAKSTQNNSKKDTK